MSHGRSNLQREKNIENSMFVTSLQNTKISNPKRDYALQNCKCIDDDRLDRIFKVVVVDSHVFLNFQLSS